MKCSVLVIFLFGFFLQNILVAQNPTEVLLNFNPLESKAWKVSFSFNKASSVQGILVWVSTERGNLSLNDFQQYKKGQILQNFKCIADQNNSLISLTHGALQANTTYYFKVFSYVTFQNQFYYVKTPFEFEMTTAGAEIGAYYDDLDETSDQFLENLSRKLLAHDFVAYRDFESNMIVDYYQRDTLVNGQSKAYVVCDYSNHRAIYDSVFRFSNTSIDYSREHIVPRNWMNFRGIPNSDLTSYPEGADFHNLCLTKSSGVNGARADFIFDSLVTISSSFIDSKLGRNQASVTSFLPKEQFLGDLARSVFYQLVCYNGLNGNSWGFKNGLKSYGKDQRQVILKRWAVVDTVDLREIAKNELIFSLQKNRNPFIDYPKMIHCIDFDSMKWKSGCVFRDTMGHVSIAASDDLDFSVEFDKSKEYCSISMSNIEDYEVSIIDLQGKKIAYKSGFSKLFEWNTLQWPRVFFIVVTNKSRVQVKKMSF